MSDNVGMRLLYVEDDARMRALVRSGLTEEGYTVLESADGDQALAEAARGGVDVVVLDIMLPGRSGIDVVRALRARGDAVPVLLLTAKDTQADVVAGLDAGADDYLTKPFSFEVLLARLRALARRAQLTQGRVLRVADLELDHGGHTVKRGGRIVALTPTEFRLLECLMRRAGRVATRRAIIEHLWGFGRDVEENTLDAFVRLLRQKLERRDLPPLIHTVRGVGYRVGSEADA